MPKSQMIKRTRKKIIRNKVARKKTPKEVKGEVIQKVQRQQEYDPEVIVDRDEEDYMVEEFQKNGDITLLEKVYHKRIPTLKKWTHDHYFPGLALSFDDFFEELTLVFVLSAHKYDKKRGRFNTFLYYCLDSRIKNIKNSRHAKKRISAEYDGPLSSMVWSLDYPYHNQSGSEITLKDVIAADEDNVASLLLEETLDVLAHENIFVKDFLKKVSHGSSIASLIEEAKTKRGELKVSKAQVKKLGDKRRGKSIVSEIIKNNVRPKEKFKLVTYDVVGPTKVKYCIQMKRTDESTLIVKTIRNLRRNRNRYMSKIKAIK